MHFINYLLSDINYQLGLFYAVNLLYTLYTSDAMEVDAGDDNIQTYLKPPTSISLSLLLYLIYYYAIQSTVNTFKINMCFSPVF